MPFIFYYTTYDYSVFSQTQFMFAVWMTWRAKLQNPVKFHRVSFYFIPLPNLNLNGTAQKTTDPLYTSEHYLPVMSLLCFSSTHLRYWRYQCA